MVGETLKGPTASLPEQIDVELMVCALLLLEYCPDRMEDYFYCDGDMRVHCIAWCDGIQDCDDLFDEGQFCPGPEGALQDGDDGCTEGTCFFLNAKVTGRLSSSRNFENKPTCGSRNFENNIRRCACALSRFCFRAFVGTSDGLVPRTPCLPPRTVSHPMHPGD